MRTYSRFWRTIMSSGLEARLWSVESPVSPTFFVHSPWQMSTQCNHQHGLQGSRKQIYHVLASYPVQRFTLMFTIMAFEFNILSCYKCPWSKTERSYWSSPLIGWSPAIMRSYWSSPLIGWSPAIIRSYWSSPLIGWSPAIIRSYWSSPLIGWSPAIIRSYWSSPLIGWSPAIMRSYWSSPLIGWSPV